jgi:hypothetical protein
MSRDLFGDNITNASGSMLEAASPDWHGYILTNASLYSKQPRWSICPTGAAQAPNHIVCEADEPILVANKNDCIESYLVSWKTWFSAIISSDQWSFALTNDS